MLKEKQETMFQTKGRPLKLVLLFQMCPPTPRSSGPMAVKVLSLHLLKKKEEGTVKARVILAANDQSSVASGSSSGSDNS